MDVKHNKVKKCERNDRPYRKQCKIILLSAQIYCYEESTRPNCINVNKVAISKHLQRNKEAMPLQIKTGKGRRGVQ